LQAHASSGLKVKDSWVKFRFLHLQQPAKKAQIRRLGAARFHRQEHPLEQAAVQRKILSETLRESRRISLTRSGKARHLLLWRNLLADEKSTPHIFTNY
jgi:hypothetical protein